MPRKAALQPGYDGRFEQSFLEVPDPFEPDKTLTVAANVRHDVILFLYKRELLNAAQKAAGDRFLGLLERAEEARGLAVDTTKEPVDGRGYVSELSESRARAGRELAQLQRHLGARDYHLARSVIGSGLAIKCYAFERPAARYLTWKLGDILTQCAKYWGYEGNNR